MPSDHEQPAAHRHPHPYAGRWIARIRWQIVGQGGTPRQALAAAYASRFKEQPILSYIPFERLMAFHPIVFEIQKVLSDAEGVFLVGGAVRDALLGRAGHDLDFVCLNATRKLARKVADGLGGDIYTLDDERDIYRVILPAGEGEQLLVDFSAARGATLDEDLMARDFTINAMAVDIRDPYKLIDPLGGARALNSKMLIACGPHVILDDPIRVLRGVRFASQWTFKLEEDTRRQMKEASGKLSETTVERRREEFLRILGCSRPGIALRALDWFGVLESTLPGLGKYRQSVGKDQWEAALTRLQDAQSFISLLQDKRPEAAAGDYRSGLAAMKLGRFQPEITRLFASHEVGDYARASLWQLGILLGEIAVHTGDANYPSLTGAEMKFSRVEIRYLQWIAQAGRNFDELELIDGVPTPLACYRYFREMGHVGVDAALSTASAVYSRYLDQPDELLGALNICRDLLDAWYQHQADWINPPVLLRGDEVIDCINQPAGPVIGKILEAIREKQVTGEIGSRAEAEAWVKSCQWSD